MTSSAPGGWGSLMTIPEMSVPVESKSSKKAKSSRPAKGVKKDLQLKGVGLTKWSPCLVCLKTPKDCLFVQPEFALSGQR
jgi:hypothetical protein